MFPRPTVTTVGRSTASPGQRTQTWFGFGIIVLYFCIFLYFEVAVANEIEIDLDHNGACPLIP